MKSLGRPVLLPRPAKADAQLFSAYKALHSHLCATDGMQQLASGGSTGAMLYLGEYYRERRMRDDAEQYFSQAAQRDSCLGRYFLGWLYLDQGRLKQARLAFEDAARSDYAPAMHLLGRMYFGGWGGPKDRKRGRELVESSVAAGNVLARATLGSMSFHHSTSLVEKFRAALLWGSSLLLLLRTWVTEGSSSERLR